MKFISKIDKKTRYLVFASIMGAFLYTASVVYQNEFFFLRLGLGFLLIFCCMFFVHYPNIHIKNYVMSLVMPIHLFSGVMLTLKYYPNLGDWFRVLIILGVVSFFYLTSLVDNIYFVVGDREGSIPLYRVALTWSQILMITIAIPLYAGVYKVPINAFYQVIVVSFSAFIFNLYQLWAIRYEDRITSVNFIGAALFSVLVAFYTGGVALAVSFIPTEAFLKALLSASTLMFGLVLISSHLKNEISKALILEYMSITALFLIILIAFRP